MPSGVFKPYAGVSTAILIFTKTNHGGTDDVWFYDMTADGFSLDDKRTSVQENDIPDIIERFSNLDNEKERKRTDKSFFVPKQEIVDNDYDLSINKYKKIEYVTRAYDQINDLSDELEDLEADLYEDEDEDEDDEDDEDDEEDADDANDDDIASEPFYEVACPNCGETVYVSEDDLDAGEANCAHCGVTFEVALEGDEEEPDEDAPVQYEVTCPDCGTTAVFEEEELLEGEPKCPNCGKPLDFEVTEE